MQHRIQELEAQLNSTTDQRARIELLNELAWNVRMDTPERSRSLSEQAYAFATSGEFSAQPYLKGLAGSLRNLAFLNNAIGNYHQSLTESLRAFEILESAIENGPETQPLMIDILGNISWTYRSFGDYGVAAEYGMKGLVLAQDLGNRHSQARMLNILANIYAESNDADSALNMGWSALQCYQELGLVDGESVVLNNLALTYLQLGDGARALEAGRESLRIAVENSIEAVRVTALSTLGEVYLGIKDYTQAETHLLQSLALSRERNATYDEFQNLLNLGKVYLAQQKDQISLAAFQDALAIAQALNDRPGEFQCHQRLAEVFELRGAFETALQHFKQFHALKETVFNENAAKRLAGLQVIHQVETAKRDAKIHYLKTIDLKKEIEERKNVQAVLEQLASIDPLTGLLNRREFFILGERAVQRTQQDNQPLTLILFDLDHFKRINDSYGHSIGDQVLVQLARTVRESLREGEIIGRYGGDEYVILLPGENIIQGQQIAERLREKVTSQIFTTPRGDISLTLSLGIAETSGENRANLEMLVEHADQALYAAKRAGRNQLAVYTAPPA